MTQAFIFEQTVRDEDVEPDDGGASLMVQFDDVPSGRYIPRDERPAEAFVSETLFVRVQSWDEEKAHHDFRRLVGKRVRVTIEILDNDPT
jgi:hypothetical protein